MVFIIYSKVFCEVFCYTQYKGPAIEARLADLNMRSGRVRNRGKTWAYAGGLKEDRQNLRMWSVVSGS